MSRTVPVRPMTMAVGLVFGQRGMPKGNTAQRRSRRWRRARRLNMECMHKFVQRPPYYLVTDDGKLVGVRDVLEWARGMEKCRRVALDRVGIVEVSTVFLGLDHSFRLEGPPVLYETMVFRPTAPDGERWAGLQFRYCTREEALAGHADVMAMAETGQFDPVTEVAVEDEHADRG